jgi:DNA (cytosine-5)-methyltransferase 1
VAAQLLTFHKIGEAHHGNRRIWLESSRLSAAGFAPGTPFHITAKARGLEILPEGKRTVSSRTIGGRKRPIIEIFGEQVHQAFGDLTEVKAKTGRGLIQLVASIRAAAILKATRRQPPWRTLELFAGGGTLSDAVASCPLFELVAGVENQGTFADIWESKHPGAQIIIGDVRSIHPAEMPAHDILVAGIPCTCHSTMGRAKKGLAGKPEEGDSGDLFAWVINLVAHRPPLACVFENVPSFGASLAGVVLKNCLRHTGYHLWEHILQPHQDWGEPSDRKRWVLVATLKEGFALEHQPPTRQVTAADCLDQPDAQDQCEAARIAKTIEGLRKHNTRHAALGHGFAFTTITRQTTKIPTLTKSYHKINTGPFVQTPWGPRMLRIHEAEAIMGANAGTTHYASAMQILGQGVQTRIWKEIFRELGNFLASGNKPAPTDQLALGI